MNPGNDVDVIDRLRTLGDAAEDLVEPVAVSELLTHRSPSADPWRRRRAVVLAAAAVVAVVAGVGFGVRALVRADGAEVVTVADAPDQQAVTAPTEQADPTEVEPTASEVRAQWEQLRQCESGGDYRAATGSGFFGAYGFTQSTWATVAGPYADDLASDVPPIVQDEAAMRLFARHGAAPWPACGQLVTGAATSPIVTGWLGHVAPVADFIVFFQPSATEADIQHVEGMLRDLLPVSSQPNAWTFIDKDSAYEEFAELFADSPELVESTVADAMPASLRVTFGDEASDGAQPADVKARFDELRNELIGDRAVLRVVQSSEFLRQRDNAFWPNPAPGHWLDTSTGLWFGYATTLESVFDLGLAAFAEPGALIGYPMSQGRFVIAGHSTDGAEGFYKLHTLVPGDTVSVLAPFTPDDEPRVWVVESVQMVDALTAPLPPPGSLVLTTEGDSPETRLIVITSEVESTTTGE